MCHYPYMPVRKNTMELFSNKKKNTQGNIKNAILQLVSSRDLEHSG